MCDILKCFKVELVENFSGTGKSLPDSQHELLLLSNQNGIL